MQTIAVAGLKGGTGKTATARNIAAELAQNRRVLLVDADPQAGLTRACGVRDASGQSMAEVLGAVDPGTLSVRDILREVSPSLWLAPSDLALSRSELGLVLRPARELVLSRALDTVQADFDVAVIDCPPAVSLLVINALVACDGVLSPVLPEMASLHALRLFWATIEQVRSDLSPELAVIGVALTFYDGRLLHHQDAERALGEAGYPVLQTRVGRSVRVAEACIEGKAMRDFAADNPRAHEFAELTREVARWLDLR